MKSEDFDFPHEIDDEHLFQIVSLGNDVQSFIQTHPVGKYVWARCRQDRAEAIHQLERLMLSDSDYENKAKQLAMRAAFPVRLIEYLQEAFESAAQAERDLIGRDEIDDL